VGGLESKLNAAMRTKITTIIMAKTMQDSWSKVDKAVTKKFNPIFLEIPFFPFFPNKLKEK